MFCKVEVERFFTEKRLTITMRKYLDNISYYPKSLLSDNSGTEPHFLQNLFKNLLYRISISYPSSNRKKITATALCLWILALLLAVLPLESTIPSKFTTWFTAVAGARYPVDKLFESSYISSFYHRPYMKWTGSRFDLLGLSLRRGHVTSNYP